MFGTIVVSLVVLLAAEPPKESLLNGKHIVEKPSPQHAQAISDFYKKCLGEDVGIVAMGPASKGESGQAYGSLLARVIGVSGQVDNLEIRPDDGVPLLFSRSDRLAEPGTEGRTHKDAISETAAWEAALRVLEFYGLTLSRDEYTIEMRDMDSVEGKDDLFGAQWQVSKDLEYKGMPCRQCQISILVSAVSGKIFLVIYVPVIVPADAAEKLTKSEAVQKANAWLGARPYFAGKKIILSQQNLATVEKVVARPNDYFLIGEPESGLVRRGSFWCWEVPFSFVENGVSFRGSVWVTVDTGEVIGAWDRDE